MKIDNQLTGSGGIHRTQISLKAGLFLAANRLDDALELEAVVGRINFLQFHTKLQMKQRRVRGFSD